MLTYVLTFLACITAHNCKLVEIPWNDTLMTCMLYGQHAMAEWQNQNPSYIVPHGWRCTSDRAA